jgi:hypothetical protein
MKVRPGRIVIPARPCFRPVRSRLGGPVLIEQPQSAHQTATGPVPLVQIVFITARSRVIGKSKYVSG